MDRRSSKNDISIFYENRNKLILNLIDSNVPFSSIAGKFKISKSNVSYIKSKRDKNNLSNGNNNKKSRKSRGADILVEDFDSGVISVLSGTTTSSPFGSDSDGPQNFRKAIKCAARTYAEREGRTNFKASEGWVEKFLMRNYPGFVEANKSKRQKTSPPTDSFQGSQQLISNIGAANNCPDSVESSTDIFQSDANMNGKPLDLNYNDLSEQLLLRDTLVILFDQK